MKRFHLSIGILCLLVPFVFLGCEGDDGATGATGAQGPAGPPGPPGQDLTATLSLESCAICHDDQNVRNGDAHQADYDARFQDNVVVVSNIAYTYNATDNQHIVTFNMTKAGQPFNCTQTSTGARDPRTGTVEDSLGLYFEEYTAATTSFDPPAPLTGRLSLGTQGSASTASTLSYDAGTNLCTSTVNDNNSAGPVGDLSTKNGIIVVYGRDDVNGALASPSRVILSVFPFAGVMKTGVVDYASAATVSGCEKCHTVPYLKHGYIYGRVGGDPATDFYTCKGCHTDNGAGGHFIWQLLVDNPQRAAEIEGLIAANPGTDEADHMTPAELTAYAYKTSLMNDVHMSHAMEFAYPQSMGNCATCHEGKLAAMLTDNNFTIETCKSCHPVTGGTDLADDDGDFTVDTRTKNPLNKQAPALASILPPLGTAHLPPFAQACNTCHTTGGIAPVFDAIHTGYDKVIYGDAAGTKYSSAITVTIDNASFADNTNTLTFGFHATGSLGGVSSDNIVPTVLVGLYGYDTKDYIAGPHERTIDSSRDLEAAAGTTHPRITITKPAAGTWVATANLSNWAALIAADNVTRVEIGVMPTLRSPALDNAIVALNAPSRTFNIATQQFENNFFGNSIVRVQGGAVGGVVSGCNNCHDALATTFHSPDRGGNVVVCRLCHITKAAGSHLELQSRSIDSYTHAIHRFQAFDTGSIDFTDPVEAMEYTHHVESNFPTFGVENCRACHNAGKFNVPNQGLSLPGVLSDTDFGTVRNIGAIDNLITGPATRACGACHRAEAIIANEGFGDPVKLANINSHMTTFGYMIETPPATILGVINEIFAMLNGQAPLAPLPAP